MEVEANENDHGGDDDGHVDGDHHAHCYHDYLRSSAGLRSYPSYLKTIMYLSRTGTVPQKLVMVTSLNSPNHAEPPAARLFVPEARQLYHVPSPRHVQEPVQ